jgi:peroxiredoxin Q/BCP
MTKARANSGKKVALDGKVPDFSLPGTGRSTFRLSDCRGRKVVLYFYPKDNTPGCTLEGKGFRDLARQFTAAGTVVFGISRDNVTCHERFKAAQKFPFELLADTDEKACRLFDVIREKNMYGKKVMGVERSTFLVGADGVLRREWRKVRVEGHAAEVLQAARDL